MFDFYLGTAPTTLDEEMAYLLSVKRLMPRWSNSIPDSEYLAIAKLASAAAKDAREDGRQLVLAETGVGASTVALAYYALKEGGLLFSWDTNGEKGSYIRTVCTETLCMVIDRNINRSWKFVNYSSLSSLAGLGMLGELTDHVDFFFHDTDHTFDTMRQELELINPALQDGGVVAFDDANYAYKHTNTAYINVIRKKLGLSAVEDIPDNRTRPFFVELEDWLKGHWAVVESMSGDYKSQCQNDISIQYSENERHQLVDLGMDMLSRYEDRFAAFQVSGRI